MGLKYYSVANVAELMGVSHHRVRRAIEDGKLRVAERRHREGIRVHADQVDAELGMARQSYSAKEAACRLSMTEAGIVARIKRGWYISGHRDPFGRWFIARTEVNAKNGEGTRPTNLEGYYTPIEMAALEGITRVRIGQRIRDGYYKTVIRTNSGRLYVHKDEVDRDLAEKSA